MMLDIGSQLDTIAKLLAGAPPGPKEKFLFQKYVYCKEDYTSWVVSLLGDLGISYTQVDSLVNGLYEYRCECTNDQFNQLILKVELSTNPVLATYKKIDSFSDLIGINVFDMDSYSAGCDSRISKSDTITADMVKYWLNVQNGQVVQRQLDLAGSASIGTYSIDFTGGNVTAGSVPVNGSIRDNILYRKQITGSAFDYSLTNCTIEGWMIDYLKNQNDISPDYTIVTGGATAVNAYDDDLTTYIYSITRANNVWVTAFEVSFPVKNLSDFHTFLKYKTHNSSYAHYLKAELLVNGSWVEIFSIGTSSITYVKYFNHDFTGWNIVTGFRIQVKHTWHPSASFCHLQLYDVSIFD